jgi:hypothetical protein
LLEWAATVAQPQQFDEAAMMLAFGAFFDKNVTRASLKIQISSQLLCCEKNFLLTYTPYAALRNFFRALHLGEL